VQIEQLGTTPYNQAYDYQMELLKKLHEDDQKDDVCMVLQHPAVFTLGRNASPENIHVPESFLHKKGIKLIRIERGGEVTYHGPGQIVCYPIINLRRNKLSVVDYVNTLEQIMLEVVFHFGVNAKRDSRNHGIWLGDSKLGSIGIAVRHGISYHGLALNVNLDLEPFAWVNPCGLNGVSMTSMEQELQHSLEIKEVESVMIEQINHAFRRGIN
jgi:lipoate-protein ligase B